MTIVEAAAIVLLVANLAVWLAIAVRIGNLLKDIDYRLQQQMIAKGREAECQCPHCRIQRQASVCQHDPELWWTCDVCRGIMQEEGD